MFDYLNKNKKDNSQGLSDVRIAAAEKMNKFFPALHSQTQQAIENVVITKVTDSYMVADIPVTLMKGDLEYRTGIPIVLRGSARNTSLYRLIDNQPKLYRDEDAAELVESLLHNSETEVTLAIRYRVSNKATKSFAYTCALKLTCGDEIFYLSAFAGTIETRDILNAESNISVAKDKIERKSPAKVEVSLNF